MNRSLIIVLTVFRFLEKFDLETTVNWNHVESSYLEFKSVEKGVKPKINILKMVERGRPNNFKIVFQWNTICKNKVQKKNVFILGIYPLWYHDWIIKNVCLHIDKMFGSIVSNNNACPKWWILTTDAKLW